MKLKTISAEQSAESVRATVAQSDLAAAELAAIVQFSSDAIVGKDLQSRVTSWNAGAERMFGYTADEMVGQSITRIIPRERKEEEATILARIKRGENVEHFETQRLRKDGTVIEVSVAVSPIKTPDGQIVGASKVARDITERKKAEKALQESEERLHMVFENLSEGLVISRLDGQLLYWNRAGLEMHGFSTLEEGVRRLPEFDQIYELSTPGGAVLPLQDWPMARVMRGGSLRGCEVHVRRRDIDWERDFSYSGALVRERGGEQLAFVTISDITQRKAAEMALRETESELEQRVIERTAQLEAANKELEAFSYSVSHDLRAPLRGIDGFSQAVLEDFGGQLPEEGQRYLQTIRQGAQRMGILIDDLLTFSRLSRAPVMKQEVNTVHLVRGVLTELTAQQAGREIELTVGDLPNCQGDPALLKQVWVNLLSNAIKYTRNRERAVVEIGFAPENGGGAFFVRDNGTGFDMRYAGKLFGVFQRLHRAEEYEGTGVGLAIVQRVVHRHGGRVWAEAAIDNGATFYFTLEKPAT